MDTIDLESLEILEQLTDDSSYISRCGYIRPSNKFPVNIPKIIYQSWKTHEIPEHWEISPESIKGIMPDWKYVLYDNEENREMVAEYFPDFLPYYDAFPYDIMRADAARYCFLYLYGGIYMDLDFEVQQDLSELFRGSCEVYLVASGNVSSVYTNSFMASQPRSKFWLEVIEEMKKPLGFWQGLLKHFVIMCQSGPLMLSRVTSKTNTVIGVLPRKRVMPCSICNIECSTCEAYLRPLQGSSWISYDTRFLNFWLCNWKKVIFWIIFLLLIVFIGWIFYRMDWLDKLIWKNENEEN
jgi:mannosyltransferase OCH1-like enzyme